MSVIVAAGRTAIGNFGGALASITASDLGAAVLRALLERTNVALNQIDEVIMGQVLTAGAGQNPARQAAISAGLPHTVPAITINKVCGSGLKAIALANQAIVTGDAGIVLAGGQESMSQAPHILPQSRNGQRIGDWTLKDSMIIDGLWDAFGQVHMGITAENIAKQYNLSREAQDAFAAQSQQRAEAAQKVNRFEAEIIPIRIPQRKGDPLIFNRDEFPRAGTTSATLAKLRPAFDTNGTVTAGNASGINDGAAAVLIMSAERAAEFKLPIMARIVAYANAGVNPAIMGTGPIPAATKCLNRAGWQIADLDLIEANEAFAAQALSVNASMGWDMDKVNVNGGAIALGHPIGASGARILVSLLYEMQRREAKKGLATLCIGGGMGIAMAIERD